MRYDQHFLEKFRGSWAEMSEEEWLEVIANKLETSLGMDRLKEAVKTSQILNIKFGIDPTASNLHIGHVVPMMLVKAFQKKGHEINVVIGDFTAMIGDPSGRSSEREALTQEQVKSNMNTYKEQIGRFVDLEHINIRFNSEWLNSMTPQKLFGTFQMVSLTQATQREDFRERLKNNASVSLAEVCYSVLMGLDSVALESDIEIGGVDQLLNFQQCREIMKGYGMTAEIALMTPILEGTSGDGRKMSKSYGNAIAVLETSEEKFGKFMSIKDELILPYFKCFAFMNHQEKKDLEDFIKENPLEAKKQLATYFIAMQEDNLAAGEEARENFERLFSKKEITPEDCLTVKITDGDTWLTALGKTGRMSNSELRRRFQAGAVKNLETGEKLEQNEKAYQTVVKFGKRDFVKLK